MQRLTALSGAALLAGCRGRSGRDARVERTCRRDERVRLDAILELARQPRAVPLGDGYANTVPSVGYVDSCITSFGGIGGARVNGPRIDTSAGAGTTPRSSP